MNASVEEMSDTELEAAYRTCLQDGRKAYEKAYVDNAHGFIMNQLSVVLIRQEQIRRLLTKLLEK